MISIPESLGLFSILIVFKRQGRTSKIKGEVNFFLYSLLVSPFISSFPNEWIPIYMYHREKNRSMIVYRQMIRTHPYATILLLHITPKKDFLSSYSSKISDIFSSSPILSCHLCALGPFWDHLNAKSFKITCNNLNQLKTLFFPLTTTSITNA